MTVLAVELLLSLLLPEGGEAEGKGALAASSSREVVGGFELMTGALLNAFLKKLLILVEDLFFEVGLMFEGERVVVVDRVEGKFEEVEGTQEDISRGRLATEGRGWIEGG